MHVWSVTIGPFRQTAGKAYCLRYNLLSSSDDTSRSTALKLIQSVLAAVFLQCILLASANSEELRLVGRYREPTASREFVVKEKHLDWSPRETAVIVVDMWN